MNKGPDGTGRVAQVVERLLCKSKALNSTPVPPIDKKKDQMKNFLNERIQKFV
jgi:hypothetical protein